MIKYVLFFALLNTCISANLYAQADNSGKKVRFGLKTGITQSSFTRDVGVFDPSASGGTTSSYTDYKRYIRISSLFGIVTRYQLTPAVNFGAELLYAGRGAAYRKENNSVVIISNQGAGKAYDYYKFRINYLELPLTAIWNLTSNSNGETDFSLYGGIVPALSTDQSTSYHSYQTSSGSQVASSTKKEGELKYVRTFNVSTVAGLQLATRTAGSLFFNAQISNSLLPVFKHATTDEGHNLNTSMWTATIGIGVMF